MLRADAWPALLWAEGLDPLRVTRSYNRRVAASEAAHVGVAE